MKRLILSILCLICGIASASAQSTIVKDFTPVCDSLELRFLERLDIENELELKAVMKRGSNLDFYFTVTLGDYPWYPGDINWFKKELKKLYPKEYKKYGMGEIYTNKIALKELVLSRLGFNGSPNSAEFRVKQPSDKHILVREYEGQKFDKGLTGRHIALWQSHGRYYEQKFERWEWQRACLFQTVEDMYTQGFVLPYLVPMLENAGAYVMLPRERDIQKVEIIADNDKTYSGEGGRRIGEYEEKGKWKDAGAGFADTAAFYVDYENPFRAGSARKAEVVNNDKNGISRITWKGNFPERGEYAVYVSYKTLENSTTSAHYTVRHLGGETEFVVNQKMGGGTWIYLGTFEFGEGNEGCVTLTNKTPKGYRFIDGAEVTADAVRFGGGMGNIARRGDSTVVATVSGMARSAEGARYWMQWAGVDSTVWSPNELKDDYKDDFMSRGDWVAWLTGGSDVNPKQPGLGVPIDLSLGFHSDAGVFPNDSIIGTLAIYTLKSENKRKLPSGEDRMTSRQFADIVQSQIVNDLRHDYDTLWNRRWLWDRGYRESRTPTSPSMLLELLSHQNFADMKYGMDPSFRFAASRAVYKGMLKYLSNRYGCPYEVQPLPVDHMATELIGDNKVKLGWKERIDPVEPTAKAKGYIVYTRIDDGAFDQGMIVKEPLKGENGSLCVHMPIEKGHIYSYKVVAFNDGGKSFPSEIVSVGIGTEKETVLVVNNFDRVSGPAFFDTPTYAGFDNSLDSGVPHIQDITYIGEMYQNRRGLEWVDDDNPGFGASYTDYAGEVVAGNTFDFAYTHGKALLKAGYSFVSCSNEAFCTSPSLRKGIWCVDLICGKQITTTVGAGGMKQRFSVFPVEMQQALREFTSCGGHLLVSGANIGTDVWDSIFPVEKDENLTKETKNFVQQVLGYKWMTNHASRKGVVKPAANNFLAASGAWDFHTEINSECYCVETPDGIVPASKSAATFLRYADTGISAGVCYNAEGYRCVSLGFPIETLKEESQIDNIIKLTIEYFKK